MVRQLALIAGACACVLALGCAKKAATQVAEVPLTGANIRGNLNVSEELLRRCNVTFNNTERAPKFDFDDAELLPQDRDVLEQIAKCVTTGPLKGRKLALVGRADPRGEVEYNMALGERRADSVRDYLTRLGVASGSLSQTSRGELDAEGIDEDSWKRDRRVDIALD
jgi:peptidoglycan-associated lipoprotein